MSENKGFNITVNVSGNLEGSSPELTAKKLATKLRETAKGWSESPTESVKNTVGDIVALLKSNELTIRQSLDVLKEIQNQIVLNMPLTSSLDSKV